jgi:glycolate oxidase iron-sulfur subunit
VTLLEDATGPRSQIAAMVERIEARARGTACGSARSARGDGNLHPTIVLPDRRRRGGRARAPRCSTRSSRPAIDLGGTITGEHGVGLAKLAFLERRLGAGTWRSAGGSRPRSIRRGSSTRASWGRERGGAGDVRAGAGHLHARAARPLHRVRVLPARLPDVRADGVETSSPRGRIDLMRALETGVLPDDDPSSTRSRRSAWAAGRASRCARRRAVRRAARGVARPPVAPARRAERRRSSRPLLWAATGPWRCAMAGRSVARAPRAARERAAAHARLLRAALFPAVSRARARLLPDVRVDPGQGCCGALHAHNGDLERGKALAEQLGRRLEGTIVTTSGGCAAHLAAVLGPERVRELSQHLGDPGDRPHRPSLKLGRAVEPGPGPDPAGPAGGTRGGGRRRIAVQDSCHLRNGLGVFRQPRRLVEQVGELVEVPSAAECCGAAGTYSILRPRDSQRILDDKLDELEAAGVDLVVAVNPGCLRQLQTGLRRRRSPIRAVHLAELLADHVDRP